MKDVTGTFLMLDRKDGYVEVWVEGFVDYHKDLDYGSDADGNRGSCRIFIDEIRDVMASDEDGGTVDLTENELEQATESIKTKFLEG